MLETKAHVGLFGNGTNFVSSVILKPGDSLLFRVNGSIQVLFMSDLMVPLWWAQLLLPNGEMLK